MKLSVSIAICVLVIFIAYPVLVSSQADNSTTELKEKIRRLQQQPDYLTDTAYNNALTDLAYLYRSTYPDSALQVLSGNAERCRASGYKKGEIFTYTITGDAFQTKGNYGKAMENYEKAYSLAKRIHDNGNLPLILNRIGVIDLNQGNYPEALSKFYESLTLAEAAGNNALAGATLNNIGNIYFYQGKFSEAESVYRQRLVLAQKFFDSSSISLAYNGLGEVNLQQKKPAEALRNFAAAYNLASQINDGSMLLTVSLSLAEAYYDLDSLQKSASLFQDALRLSRQVDNGVYICDALIGLAKTKYKQGLLKEALANGLEGLQKAQTMGQVQLLRDANEIVSRIYENMHDDNHALIYFKAYKMFSDSMTSLAGERASATEKAGYEFSKKEIEFQRRTSQQQWIIFSAFAALFSLAIIVWLVNRNRRRLNHTNKELHKKNEVIQNQKLKAEDTLMQLQATQAQLIQAEKMASLGELTAGIAHEIQNPLNFVNNFSEVNKEMLAELKEEIDKGNYEEVKIIANDIKSNEEKIIHHGKRADAIVKGMLQHSRKNNGVKELTDINKLADEYLRLSYHGLRAKDKNFNADFTTDFDESIGKINIVPQDMGRVFLNLFNNAFYAVSEKKKIRDKDYKPLVSVQTKRTTEHIEIIVTDNGNGIPQNIIDKIFQPFFTTKPTGEGTGLGLSLSYDIITKEHNGTIQAESEQGEGTTFVIQIPA